MPEPEDELKIVDSQPLPLTVISSRGFDGRTLTPPGMPKPPLPEGLQEKPDLTNDQLYDQLKNSPGGNMLPMRSGDAGSAKMYSPIPSVAAALKAAQMTPGGPGAKLAIGATAGTATLLGLDKLISSFEGSEFSPGESAVNLGVQEGLGAGFRGAKKLKDAWDASRNFPSTTQGFLRLNPTVGQYLEQTGTPGSGVSKFIEDMFGPGAKRAQVAESAGLGIDEATKMAQKMSGRRGNYDPQYISKAIQQATEGNLAVSMEESGKSANVAKGIAKLNVVTFTDPAQPPRNLIGGGSPLVQKIEGPIKPQKALESANRYLQERQKIYGNLDDARPEDKDLINAARTLIARTEAKFDPSGNLDFAKPIAFDDAWTMKKIADANRDKAPFYKQLANNINEDIGASIPKWKNSPGPALKAWEESKATVAQRHTIFEDNNGVKQLIENTDSTIPAIDQIISDPNKLNRTLTAGNLRLPTGRLASTNLTGDLQGYTLMKLINESRSIDPKTLQPSGLDMQQVAQKWADPEFQESKKLLFKAPQRADIDQFFKNLAFTQQKQGGSISNNSKMWLVGSGIALSGGLLTGHTAGAAGSIIGAKLSGAALAKLLTNPRTARTMVNLAAQQPLGFSDQMASRLIGSALNGEIVSLMGSDGAETKMRLKDGQFEPLPKN